MGTKLEIMCLYCSNLGRRVSFNEIINKTDCLDSEDSNPAGFWACLGGFSITLDGYKTIFHSIDFYNLMKASTFLLETIFWLQDKESSWFNTFEDVNELSINLGIDKQLIFQKVNSNHVTISYNSKFSKVTEKRGEYLFSNVVIDKQEWVNACKISLNEYFLVLKNIIETNQENDEYNCKEILKNYLSVWKEINTH